MQKKHARASSMIENYADLQQHEPINLTNFETKNSYQYLHVDPSKRQIQGSEYQFIDDDIDVNKIESTDRLPLYGKIDSQS